MHVLPPPPMSMLFMETPMGSAPVAIWIQTRSLHRLQRRSKMVKGWWMELLPSTDSRQVWHGILKRAMLPPRSWQPSRNTILICSSPAREDTARSGNG